MTVRILQGDCREVLAGLPARSVDTVVTSPPYFGLRSYGTPPLSWGDWTGHYGLEPDVGMYVEHTVQIFREVWRVLRDDGTMFLNLGDSYAACAPRADACDSDGTGLGGSQPHGCFCRSLCDGCREAYRIGRSHSGHPRVPIPSSSKLASSQDHRQSRCDHLPTLDSGHRRAHTAGATPDRRPTSLREGEPHLVSLASTTDGCDPQQQHLNSEVSIPDVGCRVCGRSLPDSAPVSVHMEVCICDTAGVALAGRMTDKGVFGSAYQDHTMASRHRKHRLKIGRGTSSPRPAMGKHAGAGDAVVALQPNRMPQDVAAKSKLGIPWRIAFALQADGWILRQEIIWHKLNPMPESICDRPTTAHEYVFLFAKSNNTLLWRHRDGRWVDEKPKPDLIWRHRITRAESRTERPGWLKANLWRGYDYFYEAEAIMEPSSPNSHARAARGRSDVHKYADGGPGGQTIAAGAPSAGRYRPAGLVAGKMVDWDGSFGARRASRDVGVGPRARPSKAVPNKAAGKASREAVDRIPGPSRKAHIEHDGPRPKNNANFDEALGSSDLVAMRNKRSVWPIATQSFKGSHFATFPEALVEPCLLAGCRPGGTVLDPFGGSGTVGAVADRHQMNAVLIELNPSYVEMAKERTSAEAPLLGGIVHAGK